MVVGAKVVACADGALIAAVNARAKPRLTAESAAPMEGRMVMQRPREKSAEGAWPWWPADPGVSMPQCISARGDLAMGGGDRPTARLSGTAMSAIAARRSGAPRAARASLPPRAGGGPASARSPMMPSITMCSAPRSPIA
jgi:hypothetical protein